MATKIFISHSAKSDADRAVLDKLADDLREDGFEPWVDFERLDTGTNWNQSITDALQECHAAIILFSKQAIKSDFVKYEVSTLIHRKRSQTSFGLFPVTVDNIKFAKLEKDFYGAIRLPDFQVKSLKDARKKMFKMLNELDPLQSDPTNVIENMLFQTFRQVGPNVLINSAGALGCNIDKRGNLGWDKSTRKQATALAFLRWLLAEELTTQIKALRRIERALPPDKDLNYVFDRIAPWWVNDQAAQRLCSVQQGDVGKRAAILNGKYGNWTCRMFLWRARPSQEPDDLLVNESDRSRIDRAPSSDDRAGVIGAIVPAGRSSGADLVAQIRRALCRRYNITAGSTDDETDANIDKELKKYEVLDTYPIQVVYLDAQRLLILRNLLQRFKRLTVVAMTGEQIPEIPQELDGLVTVVDPPLGHKKDEPSHNEDYAYEWYSCLRTVAD